MSFLDHRFHDDVGLYLAPGSLQIDVFIRQNYTSDTNTMAVILCELFADAETAIANATGAAFYMARAATVRVAMNAHLLAASGDHFCTQSDPAPSGGVLTCTRDFVDYDSNAIAVAAGVPATAALADAVLARIDRGKCAHAGRATYVSEIPYGCKDCVNCNTGDSAVSMGRIGWQDAWARKTVGTRAAALVFEQVLLGPLQADLLRRTWLPERFNCDGSDAHNAFYVRCNGAPLRSGAPHGSTSHPPPRPLLPGCAGPIEVTDYRVVGGDGGEEEEEETVVVWALPAPADEGPAAPLSSTSAAAAPSAPSSPIRIDIHAAAASLTPHPRRTAQLAFTCALCGARTQVAVNPAAWEGGTVFARCGGAEGAAVADAALEGIPPPEGGPCGVIHLLKDELKLFHELGGDVFPRGGGRGRRARFNE